MTPAELGGTWWAAHPERRAAAGAADRRGALCVRNLRAGERVRDVSFELWRGESPGPGRARGLGPHGDLRVLFGADATETGEISLGGRTRGLPHPAEAVRAGIGLVTENRKHEGLLLSQSVRANTDPEPVLATRVAGLAGTGAERATRRSARPAGRACVSPEQAVGELSGGNQQKVVLARWLARDCRILLFDEPTRGIDVAAKDTIYDLLSDLAAEGKAIVVVSSDLVELMAICDRLLVMSQGRIAAEFMPDRWSQEKVTQAAFSGHLARNATRV